MEFLYCQIRRAFRGRNMQQKAMFHIWKQIHLRNCSFNQETIKKWQTDKVQYTFLSLLTGIFTRQRGIT